MSSFKFVLRGSAYARVASETDTLLFCAPLAVEAVSDSGYRSLDILSARIMSAMLSPAHQMQYFLWMKERVEVALVHGYERATLALRVLASLIHHLIYQLIHAHPLVHSLPSPANQQTKCTLADA